jgi:hypothetical protein
MINISGLDKAEVLAALWNNSKSQGLSYMGLNGQIKMSKDDAIPFLSRNDKYFDYLNGRVLKIDLSEDEIDPRLYDRDNGQGAALKAIESIL